MTVGELRAKLLNLDPEAKILVDDSEYGELGVYRVDVGFSNREGHFVQPSPETRKLQPNTYTKAILLH